MKICWPVGKRFSLMQLIGLPRISFGRAAAVGATGIEQPVNTHVIANAHNGPGFMRDL